MHIHESLRRNTAKKIRIGTHIRKYSFMYSESCLCVQEEKQNHLILTIFSFSQQIKFVLTSFTFLLVFFVKEGLKFLGKSS